ncbi:MAG: CpsB/CapC family capsule biosynthesis tyrosine phosphatase [Pseudomonadota bacterium]
MIDLHCHFLPGVDDGPADMETAIPLAQQAFDNGITHAVITPHVHPGRYENTRSSLQTVFDTFKQALSDAGVPLSIGLAGEVRVSPEVLPMIADGEIPFLGEWEGKPVVLLELPHSHVPPGSDKLVGWLINKGFQPMIAHPERNKDVMRKLTKLDPFVEAGCLFQLTAMSVAGRFGEGAHTRAIELLEAGVVTIIASDAHNHNHRPPVLEPGRQAAAEIVGEAESWQLVRDRPMAIAQSKFS